MKSKILIKSILKFTSWILIPSILKLDFFSLTLKVIPVDPTFYHTNFCKHHSFKILKILKFNLTLAKHRVFCVSPHLTWISGTRFVLRGVVCHTPFFFKKDTVAIDKHVTLFILNISYCSAKYHSYCSSKHPEHCSNRLTVESALLFTL